VLTVGVIRKNRIPVKAYSVRNPCGNLHQNRPNHRRLGAKLPFVMSGSLSTLVQRPEMSSGAFSALCNVKMNQIGQDRMPLPTRTARAPRARILSTSMPLPRPSTAHQVAALGWAICGKTSAHSPFKMSGNGVAFADFASISASRLLSHAPVIEAGEPVIQVGFALVAERHFYASVRWVVTEIVTSCRTRGHPG